MKTTTSRNTWTKLLFIFVTWTGPQQTVVQSGFTHLFGAVLTQIFLLWNIYLLLEENIPLSGGPVTGITPRWRNCSEIPKTGMHQSSSNRVSSAFSCNILGTLANNHYITTLSHINFLLKSNRIIVIWHSLDISFIIWYFLNMMMLYHRGTLYDKMLSANQIITFRER